MPFPESNLRHTCTLIEERWWDLGSLGGFIDSDPGHVVFASKHLDEGQVIAALAGHEAHVIVIGYSWRGIMFARIPDHECLACLSLTAMQIFEKMRNAVGNRGSKMFPIDGGMIVRLFVFVPDCFVGLSVQHRQEGLSSVIEARMRDYRNAFMQEGAHPWSVDVYPYYPLASISVDRYRTISIKDAATPEEEVYWIKSGWERSEDEDQSP